LDFQHLQERIREFNDQDIDLDTFKKMLKERLATCDINQVKADVLPFVKNAGDLKIWSNDYFLQLADMVKYE